MSDLTPALLPGNETFNHAAARENEKNKQFIKLTDHDNITVLTIDSKKVTYNGIPAELLSDFEKKKLENRVLFLFLKELKRLPLIRFT